MHNCLTCGGQMKPLFTGWFCPRDCDRKPASPLSNGLEWKPWPADPSWHYAIVMRFEDLPVRARGAWWVDKGSPPKPNVYPSLDLIGWDYMGNRPKTPSEGWWLTRDLYVFDRS